MISYGKEMRAEDREMAVKSRETHMNIKAIHALGKAVTTLDEAMTTLDEAMTTLDEAMTTLDEAMTTLDEAMDAHSKATHVCAPENRCKQLFFSYLQNNDSSAIVFNPQPVHQPRMDLAPQCRIQFVLVVVLVLAVSK